MFSRVLILAAFITSAVMPMEAAEQSIADTGRQVRSEEHTSELQSRSDLVCRLLLEKKKKIRNTDYIYASKIRNEIQNYSCPQQQTCKKFVLMQYDHQVVKNYKHRLS